MSASSVILGVVERVPPVIAGPWFLTQACFDIPMSTVEGYAWGLALIGSAVAAAAHYIVRARIYAELHDAIADLRWESANTAGKIDAMERALQERKIAHERAEMLATVARRNGHPHLRPVRSTVNPDPSAV